MLLVDLILGLLELLVIVFWELLPAICYFTAVLLVPAATFGKIAVQYPKNPAKPRWRWQNSIGRYLQGRTIISPALGTIIGLAFWYFAGMLTIFYQYFPSSA
jgi:hypothetical protein